MADYDLTRLNPREFEQMIQAFFLEIFGFEIRPFGDGPDGGREATFKGNTNYSSSGNDPWNGYIVIQAKFKQRPQGSDNDGEWALKELRKELTNFANPKKNRIKPEYYIFATNVVLTSVQDKGSKDKAYKLIQEFNQSVPLKNYDIWDFDKIRVFLDKYESIRTTYASFITPGDVLAPIVREYQARKQSIEYYLEQQIKPKPDEKIFDETEITFRDLYVPLQVQILDDNGKPIENEKSPIEEWAIKILTDEQESKKILFIQGEAGRGKSVFSRMFADRIRRETHLNFIPILIHLRDLRVLENSLTKTLENQLETFDFVKSDPGWLTDPKTRFLFLLDGFDELLLEGRYSGGLQEFLSQIDQFQKSTHHRFLITGRPLAVYGIERLISQTKSLARGEIQPMDDITQETWLEKWETKVGIDESNDFQNFLIFCPDEIKYNLAKEPLILYLLARMHREQNISTEMFADAKGIKAKIRIYDSSIKWVLEKQRQNENERLAGLEYEELREFLTEVALCVVQSGNESAKITMIEARLKDSNTPIVGLIKIARKQTSLKDLEEEKILNNLLTTFYIKPASGKTGGSMEFVHKSFGEFLFAERLLRSLINWTIKIPNGRREKYSVISEVMNKEIYDLLGYGTLTPEIVEYLMGLLVDSPQFTLQYWVILFERLEDFYLNWCEGKFIDAPADEGNYPQFKKEQLRKQLPDQENPLGLRQVDLYTGQNVLILLLELHRVAKKCNELEGKISFYPCGNINTKNFDSKRLSKIINYSQCLSIWEKTNLRLFLNDTNLMGANLENTNLEIANLKGTCLVGAHLENANLLFTNLYSACLKGVYLGGAYLIRANLAGGANLEGADLRGANLTGANLYSACLEDANLLLANLTDTYLTEADLTRADLTGANLTGANITGANFTGANLENAVLKDVVLTEVKLGRAYFKNTKIENTRFSRHLDISWNNKENLIDKGAIFEDNEISQKNMFGNLAEE